ncbi:hypothetical protein AVEN_146483-1 [Araneus ventricosus]|uniref:Uncharacterized protein n=1 Tax=Araneus ventricosus TaxID=182803 RepID=A0A4Y2NT52_ARAVE|nr:hypothetical protein AVEN_146483-1 [Araneus ventricosus]
MHNPIKAYLPNTIFDIVLKLPRRTEQQNRFSSWARKFNQCSPLSGMGPQSFCHICQWHRTEEEQKKKMKLKKKLARKTRPVYLWEISRYKVGGVVEHVVGERPLEMQCSSSALSDGLLCSGPLFLER